jgi:hypothetical protein
MQPLDRRAGSRTAQYRAKRVLLAADRLEIRFFTANAYTTQVREVEVVALRPAAREAATGD